MDPTSEGRSVVGSDDTTQDPNETQGNVDSQHVRHEQPIVRSNETTQDPDKTQGDVHFQHALDDQPVVGSDDMTQDPDETQGPVNSEQCIAPEMEIGSSIQLGPDTSHHNGTTRVPRMLRGGKVYTIDEQGRKNVRTIGSPKDIWHIPAGEKVVIEFNTLYQPTGPGVEKFRRICGKIIRNGRFVHLHGNWRKLPLEGKEDMWCTLTKKFHFEPVHLVDHIKELTLKDLAKKRRQYRYEIKKGLNLKQGDTLESVIGRASAVAVFDSEDFEMQVDTWLSSADMERALKAKTSRAQNVFLHTLGSKSIAQVAREMEEDMGETPNRDDMFIVSHTKKDGNPVNAAAGEVISKMKEIIENQSPTERVCSQGSVYWSHNDACAQVLG
ncbi:uncharacterized protein LOC133876304 [Alnus glutinosa]|uniref:uncharacterized protein LOC133876304 n=1 Tax=Alnus glutinosa TaxID=3517 RepID=UPI002D7803E6|nr:uncharacterized protein LOC133876304 [Alnus glutinosa]